MKPCILISTCAKYLPLARWTADRIRRLWPEHPPLYFSGIGSGEPHDLPLQGDDRNWMRVTRDAVAELRTLGFDQVYLILDDHPPLGVCHSDFLNKYLPRIVAQREAAYVGLLGYGQHRGQDGAILKAENLWLEHTDPDYRWKFSLHPGLWSLEFLDALLTLRMEQYPEEGQNPWNFERHRDVTGEGLAKKFLQSSYRVGGHHWDAAPQRIGRIFRQVALQRFFDGALLATRLTRGNTVREKMSAQWLWAYSYYRGPYPLFWSGTMMQGKPNRHLEEFLRWYPLPEFRDEWERVRAQVTAA